jgi:hypothetical protein
MACGCSLYSSGSQLVIDQNDVRFRLVNETKISVSVPAKFLISVPAGISVQKLIRNL